MKFSLALVSLLLLLSHQSIAQRDKGSLRIGYAFAHFGIESVNTGAIYAEFSKPFTGPIVLAFGGSFANVSRNEDMLSQDLLSFSLRLNAYFQAFANDWQNLKVGAGVSGRHFSEDWRLDPAQVLPESAFKPGLLLIAEYDFLISEQWMIGICANGEFFGNDNSVFL